MYCPVEKINLQGNYNSAKAATFVITIVKCDPKIRSTCKSDEEINEWLIGKYLITIENTWTFYQNKYSDKEKLIPSSQFYWNPIGNEIR